jgi:hypothetical protein
MQYVLSCMYTVQYLPPSKSFSRIKDKKSFKESALSAREIKKLVLPESKTHIPTRLIYVIPSRCNPHMVKFNPLLAKSLPLSAGCNIPLAEFSSFLAKSHPLSARSHPWLGLFCSIQLDLTIFWVNPSHTSVKYHPPSHYRLNLIRSRLSSIRLYLIQKNLS